MYSINWKNKQITVEAKNNLIWISDEYYELEEREPITFDFNDINYVDWDIYQLHNKEYSNYIIKANQTNYIFVGKTEFIKQLKLDFQKILDTYVNEYL